MRDCGVESPTCIATAVEDSARPPPSTMEAGPVQPVAAITVYATTASVATTCARGQTIGKRHQKRWISQLALSAVCPKGG